MFSSATRRVSALTGAALLILHEALKAHVNCKVGLGMAGLQDLKAKN